MAYGIKYIMQFTSDRGNEIRIEVLKKDYQGEIIYKSLGGAPSLSIEQGDGAIKGSSLAFAMQADVEGELQELYTTDNKLFKVNLYKNDTLRWQGYMLPELYSENYVDAPYDVSVTATDGLATLKAVTYIGNDVNASIANIISNIVARTEISMPIVYHMQLAHNLKKNIGEDIELFPGIGLPIPMLTDTYINQAAYNGYSCYDVLNQILQSCNCNIMQINGEWLVSSNTDYSESYYVAEDFTVRSHKVIGQMGIADVYPLGTLSMVNVPALKGATVEYSHILRNSFLQNANCESRKGWNYTPDSRNPIDIPGEREMFGKIFKAYCWELHPNNIQENNSLQLWQDVQLSQDAGNVYTLSVKTLFSTNAKLFLLSVTHIGNDGVDRQLTGEGWVTQWNKSDVNSYIQITGQAKGAGFETICNIKEYDVTSVQFYLPDVGGSLRVGFINSTLNYANPFAHAPIYVTQVYLSVGNVTGQQSVTLVEPNATQEQQNVLIVYGDTFESQNAHKLETNTLKNFAGENIGTWWLNGISYTSYYNMMLQEYSRYFGVKKMQLQGVLMGDNVLHNIYQDTHSGKPLRLLTAHVDLLTEEASVTLEEIVNKNVDYEATIEAVFNNNQFGQTSGSGNNSSGGGSGTPGGGDPGSAEITAQSIVDALGYVPYDSRNPSKYITESALKSYATNDDITSVNLSIEKLSRAVENRVLVSEFDVFKETVNPLFGYFDATGNANNALKLGGHSADYFASAKAVNTLTTDLNSLASRVSINEQGISTNKTNIATLVGQVNGLANDVEILKGYWYMDDEGNVHTRHNIIVEGGGAFGKGSGGGGDVPSGGGIDEAQLWNILGQSGTQTIHSSHIPDLSGKYLSVNGGSITGSVSFNKSLTSEHWDVLTVNYRGSWSSYSNYVAGVRVTDGHDTVGRFGITYRGDNGGCFVVRDLYGAAGKELFKITATGKGELNGYEILHSNNYSDYALPLSGGRRYITSTDNITIDITTSTDHSLIALKNKDSKEVRVGYFGSYGAMFGYGDNYLSIKDDGTPTYNGNNLIHYGNIGNQNVSSAKKLNPTSHGVHIAVVNSNWSSLNVLSTGYTDSLGDYTELKVPGQAANTASLKLIKNGNVLIGNLTTDAGYKLNVGGSLNATTIYQNGTSIGSLAFKNSLVASDIPSLNWSKITSGKPTTLAGYGITDAIGTSGGTISGSGLAFPLIIKGTASQAGIIFKDIEGTNKAAISWENGTGTYIYNYASAAYIGVKDDGTPHYKGNTLYHTGNFNPANYLPLSGGTIKGAGAGLLTINRTNGNPLIEYQNNGSFVGYIGVNTSGSPIFADSNGSYNIIHSGNIGSYNAGSATKLQDNTTYTAWGQTFFENGKPKSVSGKALIGAVLIGRGNNVIDGWSQGSGADLYLNYNSTKNIRACYNGGNVIIGNISDNGNKLQVSGSAKFVDSISLYEKNEATRITQYVYQNIGRIYAYNDTESTYKDLWVGNNNGTALVIKSNGNVLIGASANYTQKLVVGGDVLFTKDITSSHWGALTLSYSGSWTSHRNYIAGIDTTDGTGLVGRYGVTYNGSVGVFVVRDMFYNGSYGASGVLMEVLGSGQTNIYGNLTVTGGGAFGSDIRYKDITSYRQIDLETIVNAPLFSFKWTDREDKVEHLGTSAQYWLGTQFKDAVNITNPKFYHLDYGALAVGIGISVAREVKGVKTEVEVLRERVNQLEKELAQYRRA